MKQLRNSTNTRSAFKKALILSRIRLLHPVDNTIEIAEEQVYYSLISEMAEKPDLVHEIHWVNKPRQLHSSSTEEPLRVKAVWSTRVPNRTVKKHCGGNWNILFNLTRLMRMSKQQKHQQIFGGNHSIDAKEGSRVTTKTQFDEGSEHNIFERHALKSKSYLAVSGDTDSSQQETYPSNLQCGWRHVNCVLWQ